MEASEQAKSAIKLIGLAAENKKLTQTEFITVRDYLLVTCLYENGSRPGPVENALVSRFKQSTYCALNDRYTILVDKHKTTRHHGPAELTVTSRVYGYLQIYALHIRPQFSAPGEDALFVKEDGLAFRPGTIGRRLTQFFQQAGIRKDVRVTATNIRKMISDKAYEMSPTKKRLIHGHMKHQERTADSNYVIRLNAERASKAPELLQGIFHEDPASKQAQPSASEPAEPSTSKPAELSTSTPAQPATSTPAEPSTSKPAKPSQAVQDSADSDLEAEDIPLGNLWKKRKRRVLSSDSDDGSLAKAPLKSLEDEHKSVLMTVFQHEINNGKLLTMNEIRTKMRGHMFLCKLVVQPNFVKKIADFVRYKTNHTRQMQLSHLISTRTTVSHRSPSRVASGESGARTTQQ